ncbi:hypothetical protein YDYSY3_05310 [Paenibacillus chitinolyticus]|nr:hypothetical protein YDYSY3_05310 [Paenibacillus chitinolyticus]
MEWDMTIAGGGYCNQSCRRCRYAAGQAAVTEGPVAVEGTADMLTGRLRLPKGLSLSKGAPIR